MPSKVATVASSVGLHARPAALLTKAAAAAGRPVWISRPGTDPVNAASLLMVMALGVRCGEQVELRVEDGDGSDAILDNLVSIIETNHDE